MSYLAGRYIMNFSMWLETIETTFVTAGGSSYVFDSGQTVRTKALHPFHHSSDVGVKPRSDLTVFVDPSFGSEVGMWGTSSASGKRVVLDRGRVILISWNERAGKHGLDKVYGDTSFVENPVVGKSPLELWKPDARVYPWRTPSMKVYASWHPGTAIVRVGA